MFTRLVGSLRRLMYGRNGSDQLSITLLFTAVIVSLLNVLISFLANKSSAFFVYLSPLLALLMTVLAVTALARMFSRNISKRQRENKQFLFFKMRLFDRKNRYFRCPNCKQSMRVPRNRGKINVRCPNCDEKFIRRT